MHKNRVVITPLEIMESLIISFSEDLYKLSKTDRFTKFDSDNDSFLGTIGEIAFKKYLESIGYKYGTDFLDNKNLPIDTKIKIDDKLYDKYDFGIKNNDEYLKIDVKTQYCLNIEMYDKNWQMAVNSNTINKIFAKKRDLDLFVFIFSDKETLKYKNHVFNKSNTKDIQENINWLINNKINAESIFKEFEVDLVGCINVKTFMVLSSLFEKDEIFRINFSKDGTPFKWKCETDMYRIYIKYLDSILRYFCPKDILYLEIKDPDEFKHWFESLYKYKNKYISVKISENIYINMPQDGIVEGIQFDTYDLFFKELLKKFNIYKKNESNNI